MDIFEMEGDSTEDEATLWSLSNEYLEAAKVLQNAPLTKVNFHIVIYYLIGHSVELSLKSYLFQHEESVEDLKK